MDKLYSVKDFIWAINKENGLKRRELATFKSNLTWEVAKEEREQNRSLQIFPQSGFVVEDDANKVKVSVSK